MANYCSNSVLFLGEPAAITAINEIFAKIELEQRHTHLYYLPDFVNGDKGHMMDISFDGGWINYETRWTPNLDLLVQLADRYQVDFISRFDEMTNWMYGEAIYHDCELKSVYRLAYEEESLHEDAELAAIREEQKFMLEKHIQPGSNLFQR